MAVPLVLLLASLAAAGCGSEGESGGTDAGTGAGPADDPATGQRGGACTYILSGGISSPTRLIDSPGDCDYELSGWVEIRSLLTIDPGVVVRARADQRLILNGGEIRAIGTADKRITLEGATAVQGFWRGIDIRRGRAAVFDYVDIRDAGQVCSIIFCPDVGVLVDDTPLAFTNSSVSNSYVNGMSIGDDAELSAFSNNRFFANGRHGLAVGHRHIPALDQASDYLGIGAENGRPSVGVHSGSQTMGQVFRWKRLNAPYLIAPYFEVEGGILQLDPGVEIQFGEEAWMNVKGNGVLQAMGTAESPVVLRGRVAQPGYWDGIRFDDSPWNNNVLQHVTLSHSGNDAGLISAYAAISLDESRVQISNSAFTDNARWGILCNDPDDYPYVASVIVDGGGNGFAGNASGNVDAHCSVRAP